MVMGAGIYQVPLIKAAREMGIYTIAVSIPGNYPGFGYADEVLHINFYGRLRGNPEGGTGAADRRDLHGRNRCCRETIGRVNDAMGLSGISYEAAKIAWVTRF